jgi:hypothetical protein
LLAIAAGLSRLSDSSPQLDAGHNLTIGRLRYSRAYPAQFSTAGVRQPIELVLESGGDFLAGLKGRFARPTGANQDGQQLGRSQGRRA